MRMNERLKKTLSMVLCLCMLLQNCPVMAFAAETDNLCDHHTEHTADCGYVAAVAGSDCTHQCADDCAEGCVHTAHDDACGYVQAVEGHACHYECAECANSDGIANQSEDWCGNPLCSQEDNAHVTSCVQYVAPENPQCFCVEKCTEVNEWCDVCGFDYTKCGGTDTAAVYEENPGTCIHEDADSDGICDLCGYCADAHTMDGYVGYGDVHCPVCTDCGYVDESIRLEHTYTELSYLCDGCGWFNGTFTVTDGSGNALNEWDPVADGETLTAAVTGCDDEVTYEWYALAGDNKVLSRDATYIVTAADMADTDGLLYAMARDSEDRILNSLVFNYASASVPDPVCTCSVKCSDGSVNSECAVCSADLTGCTGEEPAAEATRVIYVNESGFGIFESSNFYDADDNKLTVVREELEDGWVKYTLPASARYYLIASGGGSGSLPELPANADTYDPSKNTWSCSHPGYEEGVCTLCGEACPGHTGGTATCTEKAVCTICGASYGELANHSMDTTTGKCGVCDVDLVAAVTTDFEITYYFDTVEKALVECVESDGSTLTLLKEMDELVLDFTFALHRVTLEVSSEASIGKITVEGNVVLIISDGTEISGIHLERGQLQLEFGKVKTLHKCAVTAAGAGTNLIIHVPEKYKIFDNDGNAIDIAGTQNEIEVLVHLNNLEADTHDWMGVQTEHVLRCPIAGCGLTSRRAYSYNESGDCLVCGASQPYSVTVNPTENGTVTADKYYAYEDELITLTVEPGDGYDMKSLEVFYQISGGAEEASIADHTITPTPVADQPGKYTFTMPDANVYVNAAFATCDHKDSTHTTADDVGGDKHSFTCTVCGGTGTEPHTTDITTGKCICGVDMAVASVTKSVASTTYYETLDDAIQAVKDCTAEDKAVVKLLKDIDLGTAFQTISSGVFTLDLNDCELKSSEKETLIITGGNVTIMDSGADENKGTITATGYGGVAVRVWDGSVTIAGGTVKASEYGVRMNGGIATIKDGTVTGTNYGVYVYNGTFIMEGGTVNATGENGAGVYVYKGSVTVKGGTVEATGESGTGVSVDSGEATVSGGTVSATGEMGIGVNVYSGEATISGGTVSATRYGVSVWDGGTATITGGTVSATGEMGIGVDVYSGEATISGGTVSATRYGMYVGGGGTATITGGTITGTVQDLNQSTGATITLTLGENGADGATFPGGITVYETTLNDVLGEGASYWAVVDGKDTMVIPAAGTLGITDKGDITVKATCTHNGEKTDYDEVDDAVHTCLCSLCQNICTEEHGFDSTDGTCPGCDKLLAVACTEREGVKTYFETLGEAVTKASEGTESSPATLTLLQDIDLGTVSQTISSGVFTLDLNDCELKSSGIEVLRITGGDVTIGDSGADENKGTITGTGTDYGVYVVNATVNITGGTVSATGEYGAGVSIEKGTATIKGGTVEATGYGGIGVHVKGGIATIKGGTVNAAGYGVSVNSGEATVSGGTVTATGEYGAGVYVYDGEVTIAGGTVEATGYGGSGVYVVANGTVIMEGGTVEATDYGVRVMGGSATISGGTVSATRYGVYVRTDGIATIEGGTVSATGYGVRVEGGSATITGGTVKATGERGDGVSVDSGEATVSGGTVSATENGVNVYSGEATISGGTVTGTRYGVRVWGVGTATITGGTVTGDYSGVYTNNNSSIVTITGGTVTGGRYDLYELIGNITLGVNAGTGVGATFPGGITVYNTTLNDVLDAGASYWAVVDGKDTMLTQYGETEITDKRDITVKATCDHQEKNWSYTDNGDGNHTWTCEDCQYQGTAPHDFNNDAHKCICELVETFTVTFTVNDEAYGEPISVAFGEDIPVPEYTVPEGYTFSGWKDVPATMPAENITLDANLTVNTYTITLTGEGIEECVVTVHYGKTYSDNGLLDRPERTGYSFLGWYDGDTEVHPNDKTPARNVTLTAKWIVNKYSATFNAGKGTFADGSKEITIEVNFGETPEAPEPPTKQGYEFTGWTPKLAPMGAEGATYTATWKAISYTITYDLDGGALADGVTVPDSYTIESDDITLPVPTRTGYTFRGWTGTGLTEATKEVIIENGSTGDKSYTATWRINTYTVSLKYTGRGVEIVSVNDDTEAPFIVKHGEKLEVKLSNAVSSNGSIKVASINVGGDTRVYDYTFMYKTLTIPGEYVTGDMVIDAEAYVEVTINLNGGQLTREGKDFFDDNGTWNQAGGWTVKYGLGLNNLNVSLFEKAGHTCAGVKINGGDVVTRVEILGDQIWDVQWTPIPYTITLNLDGGALADGVTVPGTYTIESEAITLPVPTKEGYTFQGWVDADDNVAETIPTGSTGHKFYTATWQINTYTVSLKYTDRGVEIEGTPVATHGQELTVKLDNIASTAVNDVKVYATQIGGEDVWDYTAAMDAEYMVVTIPGEYVTGDVVVDARAYVEILINMNGGKVADRWKYKFTVDGDVATLIDKNQVGQRYSFSAYFVKDGHTYIAVTDGTTTGSGYTIVGDAVLDILWKCTTLSHVEETPATCIATGIMEHWKCDSCGKLYADAEGTTELTDVVLDINPEAHAQDIDYVNLGEQGHKAYYPCCQTAEDVEAVGHTYVNGVCACDEVQTFAVTLAPNRGVAFDGEAPVATYGQPLTIKLDNLASSAYSDVDVFIVEIDGEQNTLYSGRMSTFTIEGEHVTGPVHIYANAYVRVTVDMAGGQVIDESVLSAENGIATVTDAYSRYDAQINLMPVIARDGYKLAELQIISGTVKRNGLAVILKGDAELKAVWECLHETTKAVDNGDGTHNIVCTNTECNGHVVEANVPHDYTTGTTSHTCICGAVETYTVTFTINGEEYKKVGFEYGGAITAPEYTVPEGHTFSGWDVPATMPAQNITLDAALALKTFSVTLQKYAEAVEIVGNPVATYGQPLEITLRSTGSVKSVQMESMDIAGETVYRGRWSDKEAENGDLIVEIEGFEVTGDITIKAYGAVEIKMDLNGGTLIEENPFERFALCIKFTVEGDQAILHARSGFVWGNTNLAKRTGYEYCGVSFDGGEVEMGRGIVTDRDQTIKWHWIPNTYDAVFDADGGAWADGDQTKTVPTVFDQAIVAPEDPERTGYTFAGWSNEVDTMDAEGKTFTAKWAANKYTVRWYANGGSINAYGNIVDIISTMVDYDSVITFTPYDLPTREGYTFTGWNTKEDGTGDDLTAETVMNSTDHKTIYYAQWAPITYTVTWKIGSEFETTTSVIYGEEITGPEVTVPKNYYGYGWTTEIPDTMPADENLTIEGYWTAKLVVLDEDGNEMQFVSGGLTYYPQWKIAKVGETAYANYRGTNYKEGHTLYLVNVDDETERYEITYDSGATVYPSVPMTQNKTLQLTAVPEVYTITWRNADGQIMAWTYPEWNTTPEFPQGQTPNYPDSMVEKGYDYTFIGWASQQGGEKLDTLPAATEDANYYAVYEKTAKYFYVTWNVDGQFYKQTSVAFGAAITEPEMTLTKEGHSFAGWTVPATMPATNITLDAGWTVNTYTVTFTINGEEHKKLDFAYGRAVTAPEYTVPEGHTFSGWDVPATMSAKNITLDATLTINTYTVTWKADGEEYITTEVTFGEEITVPETDPMKVGYKFNGWPDVPETMPAKDITIEAAFTANTYQVAWVSNGGSFQVGGIVFGQVSSNVAYDDAITFEASGFNLPIRTGYKFAGWNTMEDGSGDDLTGETVMNTTDNKTVYYAQWEVNTYKVTWTVNGAFYAETEVAYGGFIEKPAYTVPEGHTFSDWQINGPMPAEDITLDATLTVNRYNFTLDFNGGKYAGAEGAVYTEKTLETNYGASVMESFAEQYQRGVKREGYTLVGWNTQPDGKGDPVTFPFTMPAENVTAYAVWKINTYTVTWIVDGVKTEETYDWNEVPAFTGSTAKAQNGCTVYTFAGWDKDIVAVTGDVTYTATYTESERHDWGTVTYKWSADGESCTATLPCVRDAKHNQTAEAKISSAVKTDATCEEKGWTTYTATFDVDWAETQTLDVEDIDELGHNHTKDPIYTDLGDGNHSIACGDCGETIVESEEHDYTYDAEHHKCICGAVEMFTITWIIDGVETDVEVAFNVMPEAPKAEKAADETFTYTFAGWDKEIVAATEDAAYTAVFVKTGWLTDDNGTTYIIEDEIAYKGTVAHVDGDAYLFDEDGYIVAGAGLYRHVTAENVVEYYYFCAAETCVNDCTEDSYTSVKSDIHWVSKHNDLLPEWDYAFDERGVILHHDDTSLNGLHDEGEDTIYYIDGVPAYMGLMQTEEGYYYIRSSGRMIKNASYWITKTNGLLEEGVYKFDEDGWIVFVEPKEGVYAENGSLYYYEDGKRTYAGLIEYTGGVNHEDGSVTEGVYDADLIYVNSVGEVKHDCRYWVSKTNGLMTEQSCLFDEYGRYYALETELKNGIYEENGGLYYYKDGSRYYAGLIKIDGYYYYVNSACKVIAGRDYWISKTNGLMPEQSYTFDETGRMINPIDLEPAPDGKVKNGIVDENGTLYYYVDGVLTYAGLIKIDGSYYYVNSSGRVITGRKYWITKTNGLMDEGAYTFDETGRMIME